MDVWLDALAFLPRWYIESCVKRISRRFFTYANEMRGPPFIWFTELTVGLKQNGNILLTFNDYTTSLRTLRLEFTPDECRTIEIPLYIRVNNVNLHLCDNIHDLSSLKIKERCTKIMDHVIPFLYRMKHMWCRKMTPDIRRSNRMQLLINDPNVLIESVDLISAYLTNLRIYGLSHWPFTNFMLRDNIRNIMQLTIESDICDFSALSAFEVAQWINMPNSSRPATYVRELRIILTNGCISSPSHIKYREILDEVLEQFAKAQESATFSLSIQAPAFLSKTPRDDQDLSKVQDIVHINKQTQERLYGRIEPNMLRLTRNCVEAHELEYYEN